MDNSIIITSITPEELTDRIRSVIREELSQVSPEPSSLNYLTRREAANLLKISLPTLLEYTRLGIIKGCRVGSRILYDEDCIKASVKEIPNIYNKRKQSGNR
jgi:excisionase family DNA binding protein